MQVVFNPFTNSLDFVGASSADPNFLDPVATESLLPASANTGAICIVKSTNQIYEYNGTAWTNVTQKFIDGLSTASANGMVLNTVTNGNGVIETHMALTPADATHPGVVTTNSQTFAGTKTIQDGIFSPSIDSVSTNLNVGQNNATSISIGNSNSTTNINGNTVLSAITPNSVLALNSSSVVSGMVMSDGQLIIGKSGAYPVTARLAGQVHQINIVNGPGSVQITTPQDIDTTSSPTFNALILTGTSPQMSIGTGSNQVLIGSGTGTAQRTYIIPDMGVSANFVMDSGTQTIGGNKTFSNNVIAPGIDSTSGGTIGIGYTNASTINIGHSGATVNILGTTNTINVTNYNVANKNIELNTSGPASSGSGVGLQVQENAVVTGSILTSSDRNSWQLVAPNTAGTVTITPGASGFTLNQGSHNPLTLSTPGLGISLDTANQILSAQTATTSQPGLLSSTDWNTFNNKQNALGYTPAANDLSNLAGTTAINSSLTFSASTPTISSPLSLTLSSGTVMLSPSSSASIFSGGNVAIRANSGSGFISTWSSSLRMYNSPGSYFIDMKVPSLSSNYSLTLPSNAGSSGQFLQTDGSGNTSWQNVPTSANTSLSNLTSTSLNQSIVPGSSYSGTLDVGSSLYPFNDIYSNGTIHAGTIQAISGSYVVMASSINANGNSISSLASPLNSTDAANKAYVDTSIANSVYTGDILPTIFNAANNQSTAANVTGLSFANATTRSFNALVSVSVSATTSLYDVYELRGVQNASGWVMNSSQIGDGTGLTFTITSAGQVQYQSTNISGWTATKVVFRAQTTGI